MDGNKRINIDYEQLKKIAKKLDMDISEIDIASLVEVNENKKRSYR